MKGKILEFLDFSYVRNVREKLLQTDVNKIIVLGTPKHGNLGDQAIAYAQKLFIQKHFPDVEYIEIPAKDILINLHNILKYADSERDVLMYHGGGNLGDLYPAEERLRILCVFILAKRFKVISFPQTMFLSGNQDKLSKIYSQRSKWFFTARETISYKQLKAQFPQTGKVTLTPDIVLTQANTVGESFARKGKGVLTLLRHDKEIARNPIEMEMLIDDLRMRFGNVDMGDTHIGHEFEVNQNNREKLLFDLWKTMSSHELIITDRLHGMIFAYMTRTPVIVANISNHKILSSYQDWLANQKGIYFLDNDNRIGLDDFLNTVQQTSREELFSNFDLEQFSPLVEKIRGAAYE